MTPSDILDRTFGFYRADGTRLSDRLRLHPDGSIGGSPSRLETWWELIGGDLLFLDDERQPTTRFRGLLVSQGTRLLLGAFLPVSDVMPWHVLWEQRPTEAGAPAAPGSAAWPSDPLETLLQTANLIARRTGIREGRAIRVLFLVHATEIWDGLADIHALMRSAPDFEPVVASIPRRYPGERRFGGEAATHAGLEALGVAHLRLDMEDHGEALRIVKALEPDLIFRQSPWELDIPEAFGTPQLGFARLCYVPYYGFNLLERFQTEDAGETNYYADQAMHRMCWRIFCETEATRALMSVGTARQGGNVVVTGHPKLDRLYAARDRPAWPIAGGRRGFRLIWAPHHSIGDDWLGFGTFEDTHAAMLDWAREAPEVEIVLKPHPALFTRIRGDRPAAASRLDAFLAAWNALPNATLAEGGDYGPLLAASDAMVTDGISFLAEYQIFDKPLVFLDSGRHAPFNAIGTRVVEGTARVRTVREVRDVVAGLQAGHPDPQAGARREIFSELLPFPGRGAARILEEIRTGLAAQ